MTSVQSVPKDWANPTLLKWARLEMGLDPRHVESLAKISVERVVAWERAEETPTLADLEVLADLYACPVGYFFLDSPPAVKLPLNFRGLAPEKVETLSYETRLHLREFIRLAEYAAFLVETLGHTWEVSIGTAHLEEPIESVARRERQRLGFTPDIRRQWSSSEDAFDFWRRAIEGLGVFVMTLKLDPQEVRGASHWSPPSPPAILVNHADMEASTGRVFTLLHEWAHLLVRHQGVVCDFGGTKDGAQLEMFANSLAAEVVVGRDEFEDFLRSEGLLASRQSWGDHLLDRIRTPFKASRNTVAILLERMHLAPSGFYGRKKSAWEKRKPFFAAKGLGGPRRVLTKASRRLGEVGLPLARLVAAGYERGAISRLDVADLLNMRTEQAERFVAWVQQGAVRGDMP